MTTPVYTINEDTIKTMLRLRGMVIKLEVGSNPEVMINSLMRQRDALVTALAFATGVEQEQS